MDKVTVDGFMGFFQTYGIWIVFLIAMFALMILPQKSRDKKAKAAMEAMKKGDKIRTIGGFYGKIVQISPDTVIIEIAPDNTKMKISKGAISVLADDNEVEALEELDESSIA